MLPRARPLLSTNGRRSVVCHLCTLRLLFSNFRLHVTLDLGRPLSLLGLLALVKKGPVGLGSR